MILDHGREVMTKFIKDDLVTQKRFTLMDFCRFDNFRVADHLICNRGKGKGLYLAGVSYDSSKENGFTLKLNKISPTELECIVEEKISLSSNSNNLTLYDDDHRVYLEALSYRGLIDLLVRIRQCTLETLLESMFPIMLHSRAMKFNKICDAAGKIRDEYKDENIYELIENSMSREEFEHCMFTPGTLVDSNVPLMNRGWSKSYKFTIDISDAIVSLNESQKRLIPAIEARIRETLIENTPRSIETRVINKLDLSEIAENIAINDAGCETGVRSEIVDEDGDIETVALAILEEKNYDDMMFGTSYGAEQTISLKKIFFDSSKRSDRYKFKLDYCVKVSGSSEYLIYTDGHLIPMSNLIEHYMVENRLSEDSYDWIREEIFWIYQKLSVCDRDEITFDIDFSDLFN